MTIRDFLFQILLFLAGILVGLLQGVFPARSWQKVVAIVVGLSMIGIAVVWAGYEWGWFRPPPPTPTPPVTNMPGTEVAEPTSHEPIAPSGSYHYGDMVVGFIQTHSEGGWGAANTASFRETASELGVRLKFYDAQDSLDNQLSAFRTLIADKDVNVIVLAAVEYSSGYDDVLREARDAGKVVIVEDHPINAPEDLYATNIGPDLVEEGRKATDAMCKLLEGSAKKNVVELVGTEGSPAAVDRSRGFRERMGNCGITITQSQTANFIRSEGKTVMAAFLNQSRDIQGVFAQNDDMGLGAIQAIKGVGLRPGVDIKIVSVDATHDAFEAMIAGELNVTVECNPLFAPQVYEAALNALNGKTLPKWIPVEESVFYSTDPKLQEIAAGRKY